MLAIRPSEVLNKVWPQEIEYPLSPATGRVAKVPVSAKDFVMVHDPLQAPPIPSSDEDWAAVVAHLPSLAGPREVLEQRAELMYRSYSLDRTRILAASLALHEAGASGRSHRLLERAGEMYRRAEKIEPDWRPFTYSKLRVAHGIAVLQATGHATAALEGLRWHLWQFPQDRTIDEAWAHVLSVIAETTDDRRQLLHEVEVHAVRLRSAPLVAVWRAILLGIDPDPNPLTGERRALIPQAVRSASAEMFARTGERVIGTSAPPVSVPAMGLLHSAVVHGVPDAQRLVAEAFHAVGMQEWGHPLSEELAYWAGVAAWEAETHVVAANCLALAIELGALESAPSWEAPPKVVKHHRKAANDDEKRCRYLHSMIVKAWRTPLVERHMEAERERLAREGSATRVLRGLGHGTPGQNSRLGGMYVANPASNRCARCGGRLHHGPRASRCGECGARPDYVEFDV